LESLKDRGGLIVREVLEDFNQRGWQGGEEEAVATEDEVLLLNVVFGQRWK
jgi:hypothetical protein